jgi:cytochrome o ubiquinol oxidase subunit II
MKNSTKAIYNKLLYSAIIIGLIVLMQPLEVYLFSKDIAILFPQGLIALKQRNLMLFIQVVMLFFVIPVYILTFAFSWWYRADNKESKYDPDLVDHKIAEIVWWGVPLVMTIFVSVITFIKTHELDPYKPIESDKKALVIQVVALQWRWLFIYPEEKIATLNYIHIPKDRPIHFRITSDAPMNSFWIPDLGGQIYAMSGMETQLFLIANNTGEFRGSSANISGKGFAGMTFITEASEEDGYQKWVEEAKNSKNTLDWEVYQDLAKPSENHARAVYRLNTDELFQKVIEKFTKPEVKV